MPNILRKAWLEKSKKENKRKSSDFMSNSKQADLWLWPLNYCTMSRDSGK